jgi:hypothetical protein
MDMLADIPELTGLFFAVALVAVPAAASAGLYYTVKVVVDGVRRSRVAKLEAQARENQDRLKSLMIQRGMSADEIERVLRAEGGTPSYAADAENRETYIVEVLSENGYEPQDIERILRAARGEGNSIPASAGRLVATLAENWAKAADIERILQERRRPATA